MESSAPATARDVVRRLLDAGVLAPAQAVDGEVVVRNMSRSNGVFVLTADGLECVVKGPGPAAGEGPGDLAREGRFYARVAGEPLLEALVPAPRLEGAVGDLLVLERTRPGQTLDEHARARGAPEDGLVLLGRALGAWRRVSEAFAEPDLPGRLPWAMEALETPPPVAVAQNEGARRLAEAVRVDEALREGIARLRRGWRRDAIVHGDVRFDNALVEHEPPSGRLRAVLIDWEHLDRGDPGWDVAGALADAVAVEAVPVDAPPGGDAYRRASPDELARLAPAGRRALHAFAEGYRETAPPETADADLRGGLQLLPARLLNIALLHAAWNADRDLSSALTLAGVAAGLCERPFAPGLALS
jgi:aminoglycoside phosphotransferase (APT) family kinase protein